MRKLLQSQRQLRQKRLAAIKKGTVALIDLGSSKVMCMFLRETDKLLKTVVSVDLRNIDKPIIRFRKAPPVEYLGKNIRRLAG